jgi:hypothetical protein
MSERVDSVLRFKVSVWGWNLFDLVINIVSVHP